MKNEYGLPNVCFEQDDLEPNKVILIKYGVLGYFPTEYEGDYMEYNKEIGVTKSVARAMKMGSMYGWDVPGINPKVWEHLDG